MVGTTVGDGRYILNRLVGTGGTADVYEATDTRLSRPVAVKVLHKRIVENDVSVARLRAEVEMSRTLRHPGIVEVFEYAATAESFLVMEYMAGGDLRRRLLSLGKLPPSEVERIARSLLETLSAAHAHGIVHRDLKPRNVLFTESGQPKIADFGLARSVTMAGLHEDGTVAGTPEYTAPESITASLWDARTDLYALGCTLYEAATGAPPFVANTPSEVLRHQVESPPPLVDRSDGADDATARLIEGLLQKDPNHRPQTAADGLSILDSSGGPVATVALAKSVCPSCGAPMSGVYRWCFSCGRPDLPVQREKKGFTILVTGPGKPGEKISSDFRDVCSAIGSASGLDSSRLEKTVPRLPFVMAASIDYGGASRLAGEIRSAGGTVAIVGTGEMPRKSLLRMIGRKALTMTPRVYLVMAGMSYMWFNLVRSVPPAAILALAGALFLGVPGVLLATFMKPSASLAKEPTERLGANMARLLATVRDPLIHARMQSTVESAASLASHVNAGEWADQISERAAALCLALDAAKSGRRLLSSAAGSGETSAAEARDTADQLRKAERTYTRTLELLGSTALEVRELSVRAAGVRGSAARVDLGKLKSIVERLSDEGAAWREIEDLGGTSEFD